MTGRSQFSFFILSFIFIVLASHYDAEAFIQKEYSLQEVLSECSNVLFGTVTEVNPKRMTAKVKPEENLKGETKFSQIKINIGVGQGNFPQQLIRKHLVCAISERNATDQEEVWLGPNQSLLRKKHSPI